jgi:hypothetical protein
MIAGIVLVSCGPKRVQEKVIRNTNAQLDTQIEAQPVIPDTFADLSLDDIRNNIEFFDTEAGEVYDAVQASDRRPMLSDEHEARLIDIAIPFGALLLDQYADCQTQQQNETVLGYVSTTPMADLVTFYTEHMERLGWSCACHVRGYEQLLLFERPERSCSVILRSLARPEHAGTSLTKIVIFSSNSTKR